MPRVSIGLPVYNGEKFIEMELKSLLSQTFTDFELIISDNASLDATSDICLDYAKKDSRIRFYRSNINRGAAWNYNHTFRLSKGEYFKWAAHDDIHLPKFLEKSVNFMDGNKSVILCFTKIVFIDEDNNELSEQKFSIDLSKVSLHRRFRQFIGAKHIDTEIFGLIRRETLRKTRLIDGFVGSDFVLLGELALHGPFYQIPEILFLHREHPERSAKVLKSPEEFSYWYDSSKQVKIVMPFWRRLYECTKSVLRHPLKLSEKIRCLIEVCRIAKWCHKDLLSEISRIAKINNAVR